MHAPDLANFDPVPNSFPATVRKHVQGWSKLHVQRESNTESLLSAGTGEPCRAGEDLKETARTVQFCLGEAALETTQSFCQPLNELGENERVHLWRGMSLQALVVVDPQSF